MRNGHQGWRAIGPLTATVFPKSATHAHATSLCTFQQENYSSPPHGKKDWKHFQSTRVFDVANELGKIGGGGWWGRERPKRHREIFLKRNVSEAASRGKSSFWSDFERDHISKQKSACFPPICLGDSLRSIIEGGNRGGGGGAVHQQTLLNSFCSSVSKQDRVEV